MKTVKMAFAFAFGVVGCTLSAQSAVLVAKAVHSQQLTVAVAGLFWLCLAGLTIYAAAGFLSQARVSHKLSGTLLASGTAMGVTVIALAWAQLWFVTGVGCAAAGIVAAILLAFGIALTYLGRFRGAGSQATAAI
jgi:hypothetical protein